MLQFVFKSISDLLGRVELMGMKRALIDYFSLYYFSSVPESIGTYNLLEISLKEKITGFTQFSF